MLVSISGLDNLGKSTQCTMLHEQNPDVFSMPYHINMAPSYPKLKGKELSDWWFDPENAEEFTDTMYRALAERKQMALNDPHSVAVLDKGIDFYDVRIKSALLTRGLKADQIISLVRAAKEKYHLHNTYEDLKIIIVPPTDGARSNIRESERNENESIYEKYLGINTRFLNSFLKKHKVFAPVEFIENGAQNMSEQIQVLIKKQLDAMNQPEEVQRIAEMSKKFFGENLKMLILAGSTGKGHHIPGWSDLDFYYFFDKIPHDKMLDFTRKISHNRTHVGATYYSLNDLNTLNVDNRTLSTFYEISQGANIVLFNPDGIQLPQIPLSFIQKTDEEDIPNVTNLVKRQVYYDNFSPSTFIKKVYLLEKLLVRSKNGGKFTYTYDESFDTFAEMFGRPLMERYANPESEFYDPEKADDYRALYSSLDIDILDVIKRLDEPKIADQLRSYGESVLRVVDESFDFSHNNKGKMEDLIECQSE